MRGTNVSLGVRAALAVFSVTLSITATAAATESVLHAFNPHVTDGTYPQTALVSDAHGNLYGTTSSGGSYNAGTVFEVLPNGSGGWTEKVLYNFKNSGNDGTYPYAALILDGAGNLYGTTGQGGDYNGGTVFELSPNGSGGWTEKKLHNFGAGRDGSYPEAGLTFDSAGNIYGTTSFDSVNYSGTVFELSPNGSGGWTETILHRFNYNDYDGEQPYAGVIFDGAGNIYGTTQFGGDYGGGMAFELISNGSGGWTEKKLHSFGNGTDGWVLYSGLVLDAAGNLYGTTYLGGSNNVGIVFELMPSGGGWTEKKLHNFGNGTDGSYPQAGLILDAAGNLYGTTANGGDYGYGTVFEMTPNGSGGWTEKKLHNFGNGTDGSDPVASLVFDTAGNLYSTSSSGGNLYYGTVFELSPKQNGGWTESILHSFNLYGSDGAEPWLGNLAFDAVGNLYGMTPGGGTYGWGVLFELSPNGSGGWTETVLHNFKGDSTDGGSPYGTLIFDGAGNLYGTALIGGHYGAGTIFEFMPNGGGWTEKLLHNFGSGTDGGFPFAGMVFDRAGNLYGTTYQGGSYNRGTVFELSPNGSGGWTEKKLHNFNPNNGDGYGPYSGVVMDAAGNLYGTTAYGGDNHTGVVFELTPNGSGGWTENKLHNFGPLTGSDGIQPYAGLVLDGSGNLYGTTTSSGNFGPGTVFEVSPNGSGGWTEKILHTFNGTDGSSPEAGLTFDAAGNLYGTTAYGGDHGAGTVFKLTPNGRGGWTETKLHNFSNGSDGAGPYGGVIFDSAGNLYGTTVDGGNHNFGTVFKVTP